VATVYGTQGIEVEPFSALPTVSYQVNLQEARALVIPVGEGADGDGPFQQTSWLGGAEGPPEAPLPVGAQQSVNGGRTHPVELLLYFRGDCQFTVLFQHLDQFWEEGLQPAGA
jgi:hypothetical protein